MYLGLIALPLLGSLASGLLGRKLGTTGCQVITCLGMLVSTAGALVCYYEVALAGSPVSVSLGSWLDCEFLQVTWGFEFDTLTVSLLIPVVIVSALVHLYSVGYMAPDPHQQRFFAYLSLFTFFMELLVSGENLLVLFIGRIRPSNCAYRCNRMAAHQT
jgi:NADH-ubiquinone oxidoreductase chain 5